MADKLKTRCVKGVLQWAAEELRKLHFETPRLDAEVLLAHTLKMDRIQLYLDLEKPISEEEESYYRILIQKRLGRAPVSYLTGHKEFMSLDFRVDKSVLIPRPETELLVETVCNLGEPGSRVLEPGTGSGAIAVSLARYNPDWHVVATDLSMEALLLARENARRHGVVERVSFLQADLFRAFKKPGVFASGDTISPRNGFDWVVSNPPYVSTGELAHLPDEIREYEPILALDGGADGLDVIRRIIKEAYMVLKPDGRLAIEIGSGQSADVLKIAGETGRYSDCSVIKDYSGIPRVFHCICI